MQEEAATLAVPRRTDEFAFDAHEAFDLPAIRVRAGAVVAPAGRAPLPGAVLPFARFPLSEKTTFVPGVARSTTARDRPVAPRFDAAPPADPPPRTVPDPDTFDLVRKQPEAYFASPDPFR